ncbi:hypothetical protein FRC17_005176, partial [Serendipita sp. 399]
YDAAQASCLDWPIGQRSSGYGSITLYFEGLFALEPNPIYTVRVDEDEPVRLGEVAPRFLQRCEPMFAKTDLVYAKHRVIVNITDERKDQMRFMIVQGMIVTTPDPQDGIPFNATEQFSNATSTAPGSLSNLNTGSGSDGSKPSLLSQIISSVISLLLFIAICCCCWRCFCKGRSLPRLPRPKARPQPSGFDNNNNNNNRNNSKAQKTGNNNNGNDSTPLPLWRNNRANATRSSLNTTTTTNTNNSNPAPPPYSPTALNRELTTPSRARLAPTPVPAPTPAPVKPLTTLSPLTSSPSPISPPAAAATTGELRRTRSLEAHNPISANTNNSGNSKPTNNHHMGVDSGHHPMRAQSPGWQDSSEALD